MDYQTILKEQQARELRLQQVLQGSPDNKDHIRLCLDMVDNEPDDLVRSYAKLWLEYNARAFAKQILK